LENATTVVVALGSNLGDRREHLLWAMSRLARTLQHSRASSIIETDPVGVPDVQPPYLNAVIVGRCALSPRDLHDGLLALELERNRERGRPNAPRTLDLDLILYGEMVVTEAGLEVPHPRFRDRRFVLEPLAEVAPELRDPVSGLTVARLLARLGPRD
jgi:2-amino-4-hydroxy-6-hydroxymethyldihydropteridine diphosphokinase